MSNFRTILTARTLLGLLIYTVVGLSVFGCGGNSSILTGSTTSYNGKYVGTFTNSSGNSGELYFNIVSNGSITATGINTSTESVTTLTGSIVSGGYTVITPTGGGTSVTGTLSLSSSNLLSGTLSDTSGDSITIQLPTAQGGSTPAYAGDLSGSYTGSNGHKGTLTLLVTANGTVSGLIDDTTSNTENTLSGSISNTGVVDITSSNSAGTYTGTITLGTGNAATGTLTNSKGGTISVSLTLS